MNSNMFHVNPTPATQSPILAPALGGERPKEVSGALNHAEPTCDGIGSLQNH